MARITKIEKFDTVADFDRLPDAEKQGDKMYEKLVESFIRQRYSVSAEFAILRQQNTKHVEFVEYNAYAEQCKAKAKEILNRY